MRASLKWQKIFLLLSPSPSITRYVSELKSRVHDILGHDYEGCNSLAHISVWMRYLNHAENFLYSVEDKMRMVNPFIIGVKNLNVFHHGPNQRTIYLEVVNKTPACELWEKLVGQEKDFTPHITIARNLSLEEFDKVWSELKDVSYSDYFRCDRLTVLRWKDNKWNHHIDIPFSNN
jgi:hypothetical protein